MHGIEPRSCFYAYRESPDHNPSRRLILDGVWRGRHTPPRDEFTPGDDAGNEALRILDVRETKYVPDTNKEPPPGWTQGCDYKTYIHVAVANGRTPFGLLCVDAVDPDGLTDADKRLVQLLAQFLGCALAIDKLRTNTAPKAHLT